MNRLRFPDVTDKDILKSLILSVLEVQLKQSLLHKRKNAEERGYINGQNRLTPNPCRMLGLSIGI
jgi:hypothetical protein